VTLAALARQLNTRSAWGRRLPPLILVTDEARLHDPCPAARALPRGSAVLFRHYGHPERAALARRLAVLCRRRGLKLIVAGDWRLAYAVGAHGVHLPEQLVPRRGRIRRRKRRWLVTAAAHGAAAIGCARRAGADAVLLSPVFPTRSHPGAPGLGVVRFAGLVHHGPLPVYALGGVNEKTARRLIGSGAIGIAAIGGLAGGHD